MSCTNATGPVNIINSDKTNSCSGKCKLAYTFNPSSVVVTNENTYLSILPSDRTNPVATYSSNNTSTCNNGGDGTYSVNEVRIYTPSLHTYAGSRANGEVIISLNNMSGGRDIIICVPITTTNGTLPKAGDQLKKIIQTSKQIANSPGESGAVPGLSFNLNDFIPNKVGFYAYIATLPYSPCTKCTGYIVYDARDAAISLESNIMSNLAAIVNASNIEIQPITTNLVYAYNKDGAIDNMDVANSDLVFDCRPIGSEGEVLITESKVPGQSMFSGMSEKVSKKWKNTLIILAVVFGILLLLLIIGVGIPALIRKMVKKKGAGTSSGGTSSGGTSSSSGFRRRTNKT
jgi:carbonic anhydrase